MKCCFAEACQNRFVLVDALDQEYVEDVVLENAHEILIREQRDDVLVLYHGTGKSLKMMVYGADKQLGEFCGNGALGAAAYLFKTYCQHEPFYLETPYGFVDLMKQEDGTFSLRLPPVRLLLNPQFVRKQQLFGLHYVEMMEPHLVMEGQLSDEELFMMGRKINAHKDIFPLGINVNAFHVLGENRLFVKTYERGVQRLTKACGSGSIACAAFSKKEGQLFVSTPGGELEIFLNKDSILLKGAASFCDI